MVYKWYILPIGGLYATYHLLRDPKATIEHPSNWRPTLLVTGQWWRPCGRWVRKIREGGEGSAVSKKCPLRVHGRIVIFEERNTGSLTLPLVLVLGDSYPRKSVNLSFLDVSWYLPSLKLTVRTCKWMVGILLSFWDSLFSGTMLVSGRVPTWIYSWFLRGFVE